MDLSRLHLQEVPNHLPAKPVFSATKLVIRVVVSYKGKYVHKVLVNPLVKLAQEKSVAIR